MAHLVRWFTELADGDFPVRKLLVYQRVIHMNLQNDDTPWLRAAATPLTNPHHLF